MTITLKCKEMRRMDNTEKPRLQKLPIPGMTPGRYEWTIKNGTHRGVPAETILFVLLERKEIVLQFGRYPSIDCVIS